jgi:hypothetical protein
MTEENVPGSKYVNILAYNISSWCTSSRGTIFKWGTDIEQSKVSDIPSRNSEINNLIIIIIIIIIIIQFFIIYVPSQQLQGQLHTQHSVDKSSNIREKLIIKSKTN